MKAYVVLAAAALALAACEDVTTRPAPAPSPVEPVMGETLSGTYNLKASDCTTGAAPETRLVIAGNHFTFHESVCTAGTATTDPLHTTVKLSCTGEGKDFERMVKLQTRPGELRMTDGTTTLTYFRCPAPAQTVAVVATATPAAGDPAAQAAAADAAADAAANAAAKMSGSIARGVAVRAVMSNL